MRISTASRILCIGPRTTECLPFLREHNARMKAAWVTARRESSSIVTVNMDGRQDWIIAQRQALLAWTGHTLSLKPLYNVKLGLSNWGNTHVTGRGLLALVGSGQIYQVQVKAGESYVAHPRYATDFGPFLENRLTLLAMSWHTQKQLLRLSPSASSPLIFGSKYRISDSDLYCRTFGFSVT